jgi:hypothetical protein
VVGQEVSGAKVAGNSVTMSSPFTVSVRILPLIVDAVTPAGTIIMTVVCDDWPRAINSSAAFSTAFTLSVICVSRNALICVRMTYEEGQ